MDIKIIALDLYGTILATDNSENNYSPRRGFYDFVTKMKEKEIKLVTASDMSIRQQKLDLKITFNNHGAKTFGREILSLEDFDKFFCLPENPKDFEKIIDYYGIKPRELYVFGDRFEKDILGAIRVGCPYTSVLEYRIKPREGEVLLPDPFDFRDVDF